MFQDDYTSVSSPELAAKCRKQSLAIAQHDPAGEEVMQFILATYEWPVYSIASA
jgi:hypothetical protein